MDAETREKIRACFLKNIFRGGKWLQLLVFCIALCPVQYAESQISHGGRPLEIGAEKSSGLRSAVDYFVEMPSFDLDSVLAIDNLSGNRSGALQFAYKFFVNLTPENSGVVFHTVDGSKVWKVGIRSRGAYTLNVLFSEFLLPDGAKVYLYNTDRSTLLGSFTNENRPEGGEFSVSPVDGEELTIEYHEPADAAFPGKIGITEVNHDYRGLFRSGTRFNLTDLPCLPDLSCNNDYDTIGRSVCLLIINGDTYCTGTLINNTANDGKPYLITASHCFGGSGNNNDQNTRLELGKRVVFYLNYDSPHCDKRIRGSEEFSLSGSITRAISVDIDFALLELTEAPPADYRPYLAGWSLDSISANTLPFTGIHHPFGEVKKYCLEEDSVSRSSWTSGENIAKGNHWNIKKWEVGHTWAGSSGSPIFDKNNRFRGGLSGGDSDCDNYVHGDYYYRFDKAWNQHPDSSRQLKHWLNPLTPDSVQSPINLDGLDPYAKNPAKRINNMAASDSMGIINLPSPNWGTLFGQNSLGSTTFAEHFTYADSSMIQGVYLVAGKGHNNSDLPITVRVYQGGGTIPGKPLGKSVLNPNYVDYVNGNFVEKTKAYFSNRENYLRFDTPISVGKDFYVGYEICYPIKSIADTFYVYAAIRENAAINTAFFQLNNNWYPYTNHPFLPVFTSLWMEPVISNDTITTPNSYHEETEDTVPSTHPSIAYASNESLLYITLPDQWLGNTIVEIFDITGHKLLESSVSPPIGTINFSADPNKIILIRLRNDKLVYVLKTIIGMK